MKLINIYIVYFNMKIKNCLYNRLQILNNLIIDIKKKKKMKYRI